MYGDKYVNYLRQRAQSILENPAEEARQKTRAGLLGRPDIQEKAQAARNSVKDSVDETQDQMARMMALFTSPRQPLPEGSTRGYVEGEDYGVPAVTRPRARGDSPAGAGYPIENSMIENLIREEATARGIDPDIAVRIYHSEGRGSYQSMIARDGQGSDDSGRETSYGPFQLYTGGGLGNEYEQATGRELVYDNTEDGIRTQVRFALDKAVDHGWAPWYGRSSAGIGVWDGLDNAQALNNWR